MTIGTFASAATSGDADVALDESSLQGHFGRMELRERERIPLDGSLSMSPKTARWRDPKWRVPLRWQLPAPRPRTPFDCAAASPSRAHVPAAAPAGPAGAHIHAVATTATPPCLTITSNADELDLRALEADASAATSPMHIYERAVSPFAPAPAGTSTAANDAILGSDGLLRGMELRSVGAPTAEAPPPERGAGASTAVPAPSAICGGVSGLADGTLLGPPAAFSRGSPGAFGAPAAEEGGGDGERLDMTLPRLGGSARPPLERTPTSRKLKRQSTGFGKAYKQGANW